MRISPRPAALVACAVLALGGAGTALGATDSGPVHRTHTPEAPQTRHEAPPLAVVGARYFATWTSQREAESSAPGARPEVAATALA
jgi:hypothetical protein